MALTVGVLKVSLRADANPLFQGIAGALKAVEGFAKKTKEMAGNVAASAGALSAMGTAAVALAASVDLRARNAVDKLRNSSTLFSIQVADLMMPAMKELSAMFRRAADAVAGLSPHLKEQLSHWAVITVQVAATAKGIQLLMGVVAPLASVMSTLAGVIAGIGAPFLYVLLAIAGLAGAVALLHKAWRENWMGIQEATKTVVTFVAGAIDSLTQGLVKGFQNWVRVFSQWFDDLIRLIDMYNGFSAVLREPIDTKPLKLMADTIRTMLDPGGMSTGIKEGLRFGKELGGAVVDGFIEEWKGIFQQMGITKLWDEAKAKFDALMAGGGGKARAAIDIAHEPVSLPSQFDAQAYAATGLDASGDPRSRFMQYDQTGASRGMDQLAASLPVLAAGTDAAANATKFFADRAAAAAQEIQDKMAAIGDIALSGMTRAMGEVGNLINAGVQGAKVGGLWGAVAGIFFELIQKTQAVASFISKALDFVMKLAEPLGKAIAPIFNALSGVLDQLVPIFTTIFDALAPFFTAIAMIINNLKGVFQTIGHLLKTLSPILQLVGKLLQYLAPVIWLIGKVLGFIVNIIISVLNPIIAFFMEIAGNHEGAAALMREVGSSWSDWATTGPDLSTAADGAATALDGTAAAAQAVTEQLMNVPTGYKVNEARFAAAIAEGMGPQPGGATGPWSGTGLPTMPGTGFSLPADPFSGGGGSSPFSLPDAPMPITSQPITVQGDLVVQAQDPEDMAAQLHARVVRLNGQRYGTPLGVP